MRIIVGIGGLCANHDGVTRAGDDLSGACRARSDRRAIGRGRWRAAAEPELNAGLVAEAHWPPTRDLPSRTIYGSILATAAR
jgi:hypothetical protein